MYISLFTLSCHCKDFQNPVCIMKLIKDCGCKVYNRGWVVSAYGVSYFILPKLIG